MDWRNQERTDRVRLEALTTALARGQKMEQQELADILWEMYDTAPDKEQATQIHLFGIKYAAELAGHSIPAIRKMSGVPDSYHTEIYKGVNLAKYVELKKAEVKPIVTGQLLLQPIRYDDLNAKQKEIYNFQKIAAALADYGFNCIKLQDDWLGADFLAYHKDSSQTLRVQLKGRATIEKKYQKRDLWIAFPIDDDRRRVWYLVPHDKLVALSGEHTNWLNTDSWKKEGSYNSAKPNVQLREALEPYKLQERKSTKQRK